MFAARMSQWQTKLAAVVLGAWISLVVDFQTNLGGRSGQLAPSIAAVVTLRAYDAGGKAISRGSGFFLPDGRIVTNRHVLEGAALVEARGSTGELLASYSYAEVISFSSDLAVLPKAQEPPSHITLSATNPGVGTHIYVIGAPLGLQNSVSDGIVSAIRNLSGENLLQMTAPISPGSSGGPVIDDAGNLVGVSLGQIPDGQNLNFAVPVLELKGLIGSPAGKIAFPPRQTRTSSSSGEVITPRPARPGLLEILPASATSYSDDLEFRVGLLGCYVNESHDVIVCVCDFKPIATGTRKRTLSVFHATLQSLVGGHAVSDSASDLSATFPFSGGRRSVTVTSTGGSLRLFFRFIVQSQPGVRPVLELGVGGRQADRLHRFPPVGVIEVDPNKDPRMRSLFGGRE